MAFFQPGLPGGLSGPAGREAGRTGPGRLKIWGLALGITASPLYSPAEKSEAKNIPTGQICDKNLFRKFRYFLFYNSDSPPGSQVACKYF
jgi:hypothetical protein